MEHLIDDVRRAADAQCWYSALTLALVLPDACAKIDRPGQTVATRYVTLSTGGATDRIGGGQADRGYPQGGRTCDPVLGLDTMAA
jgi:hypothetical protein